MYVCTQRPTYNDVRCQLSLHRSVWCIPIPDPFSLLEALKVTRWGRELHVNDLLHGKRLPLHTAMGGRLLVFCMDMELEVLHQTKYVICDETFKMPPDTAYQVYTIHGYKTGNGLPLAWVLLPNKTTDTYREQFGSICSAWMTTFGCRDVQSSTGRSKNRVCCRFGIFVHPHALGFEWLWWCPCCPHLQFRWHEISCVNHTSLEIRRSRPNCMHLPHTLIWRGSRATSTCIIGPTVTT